MENVTIGLSPKQQAVITRLLAKSRKGMAKAKAKELIARLDRGVRSFQSGTPKEERRPAIEAYSQAARLVVYATEMQSELAKLVSVNQRRMVNVMKHHRWDEEGGTGKPPRKRGRRCLGKSGSAAEDLLSAALQARDKASKAAFHGWNRVDVDFRQLCTSAALDWEDIVGRPLPLVEYRRATSSGGSILPGPQLAGRQHPLWVVLDSVGIRVDAFTLDEILSFVRREASARLHQREWRHAVPRATNDK